MPLNDHLVLSSSYFNITGGRRQDSADTFRVLASLQTHSGEQAALYAVSEASTPGPMGGRARRLVIDVIQGEYSSRFDLPAATRLRSAVEVAHRELQNEFKGHVRVGLTVLVAEGPSLLLLQVPPAQAYVLHDGNLHSVSGEVPDSVPFSRALGSPGDPTISLFKDTMEADDLIVLCGSWFAQELQPEELRAAFSQDGPDAITTRLFQRARQLDAHEATCIALQATVTEDLENEGPPRLALPDAGALSNYLGDAVASLAYVWRRTVDELRAEEVRMPPSPTGRGEQLDLIQDGPNASEESDVVAAPVPIAPGTLETGTTDMGDQAGGQVRVPPLDWEGGPAHEHGTEEVPIVPDIGEPWTETTRISPEASSRVPQVGQGGVPEDLGALSGGRESELDEVNSFIQNTMNLGKVSPPVQGFPDMNVAPERIYPGSGAVSPGRRRRFGEAARPSGRASDVGDAPFLQGRVAGTRGSRRTRVSVPSVPPAMWLWSAIGLGLVIIIIVGYTLLSNHPGGASASTIFIDRARVHARKAEHAASPAIRKKQLALAWRAVGQTKSHGYSSEQQSKARSFVEAAVNRIKHIRPIAAADFVVGFGKVNNFAPGQIAGGSSTLYVLDSGGKRLYSVSLDTTHTVKMVVDTGAVLNSATPSLTWHDPVQLTSNGNTMIALDDKYDALTYVPGQTQPSMETLVPPGSSSHVVAVTSFDTNIYLLDTAAGQIWRYYGSSSGGFGQYSSAYLGSPNPKLFSRADSLAVDGSVYIGLSGGRILKFTNGQQVAFKIHVPFRVHVSQLYTRSDLKYLFVLDSARGRVLEIDKNKGYVRALALPHSARAPGIRGMVVSSDGRSLYLLSGPAIYRLTIPG